MAELTTALGYVAGAIVYSLVTYYAKKQHPIDPEAFDVKKFARTVLIGVIVGLFAWQTGASLSLSSFQSLVAASGAAMLADQIVKILYRFVMNAVAQGGEQS